MTIKHSEHSSYREKLVEHLFVGELLKLSWQSGDCALEIASPEVDNSGYDLIAEQNGIVRHIQLKASYVGGKTARLASPLDRHLIESRLIMPFTYQDASRLSRRIIVKPKNF